jgi:hypothetical protein
MSSPPVTRSVCFVDGWLSFCTFSFGHCVVCSSSIYGFWLPLWYLQTLVGHVQLYIHIIHLFNHFKNKYYFKVWSWKFLLFYSWTVSNNTLNLKTVMHVIHKYTRWRYQRGNQNPYIECVYLWITCRMRVFVNYVSNACICELRVECVYLWITCITVFKFNVLLLTVQE